MFSRDNKPTTSPTTPVSPAPSPATEAVPRSAAGAPSIISPDLTIKGNLACAGDIQIDGHVEGDVVSRSVKIGEGADMRGTITAETVRICGIVDGDIKATTVALEKTARVTCNIVHHTLSIAAGAWFEGQCRHADGTSASEDKRSAVKR